MLLSLKIVRVETFNHVWRCPTNVYVIVTNPLQSIVFSPTDSPLLLSSVFSLPLQCVPIKNIAFKSLMEVIELPSTTLSIEQGIKSEGLSISSIGRCLLLQCKSFSFITPMELPFFFPMHCNDNMRHISKIYTIRMVIANQGERMIIYKRLFPSRRVKQRIIYDVRASGRWIKQDGESVQEVDWRDVRMVCPLLLQYECS